MFFMVAEKAIIKGGQFQGIIIYQQVIFLDYPNRGHWAPMPETGVQADLSKIVLSRFEFVSSSSL